MWLADGFLPLIMKGKTYFGDKYKRTPQDSLVQDFDLANYEADNLKNFFNKGHLAPAGDFFYGVDKTFSSHYINVSPQWLPYNSKYNKLDSH